MGRINKNDISGPTPLVNTNNQQQQASANDGNGNQASGHRASFQASNVNAVSGQRQQLLTSVTAGPASLPPPPAIQAFQDIRLDASASVAGGPMDPRVQRQHLPPPKMTMRQLQGLVQAVGSYRRQIQALSAASEMFVRSLEDVLDVLPSGK